MREQGDFLVKRRTIVVLSAAVALLLTGMLLLRSYKLELVYTVVSHSLLQKSAPDYPKERVEQAFEEALNCARLHEREADLLDWLVAISLRLEKVQGLEGEEIDQLLEELFSLVPDCQLRSGAFEEEAGIAAAQGRVIEIDGHDTGDRIRDVGVLC